jgi:hypothetical protein
MMHDQLTKAIAYKIKKHLGLIVLTEIIQLINGVRSACRFTMSYQHEALLTKIASQLDLYCIRSSLPVEKYNSSYHIGRFNSTDTKDQNSKFYYYLAKNNTVALLALFSEGTKPELQGKLFGYPQCCINFFVSRFGKANEDLVYEVAKGQEKYSFWNNRATKLLGYSLISHFPCSWDCKFSEEIAKKTYFYLKEISPGYAGRTLKILNQNLMYSTAEIILLGSKSKDELDKSDRHADLNNQVKGISNYIYLPFNNRH